MSMAITSQGKASQVSATIIEGTPICPFCKKSEYVKAETVQMSTVKAAFECVACGLFRIAKPEEVDIWAKMKGRVPLPPPLNTAITMDPEVVARSTNIVHQ
jgi:hypothetical protein